jgi:septum formation protein
MLDKINKYNILLASKSPRRQELLKAMGIKFVIPDLTDTDEIYPKNLKASEIPLYLSKLKADAYKNKLQKNDILITADTIVWHKNKVLTKPRSKQDAFLMLSELSGQTHSVFTGVCISMHNKKTPFAVETKVKFKNFTKQEIEYYIEKFKPFDKAGSYGIQEWIGYIGVTQITGSFYNVMGLPTCVLYSKLTQLID